MKQGGAEITAEQAVAVSLGIERRIFSHFSPVILYRLPGFISRFRSYLESLQIGLLQFLPWFLFTILSSAMNSKPEAPDAWEEDWESQADVCVAFSLSSII